MSNASSLLLILSCAFIFVGCASTNKTSSQMPFGEELDGGSNVTAVLKPKKNISRELVRQGVIYLRNGNYDDAQKVFSAAIKVNPQNSTIHVLNGISYHLEYINGSPDSRALAETAYSLANTLDKSDSLPLIQLGRLHMGSGNFSQASKNFIAAHALNPNDQDALAGILQSSLLQKDFKTALWAGDKIKSLKVFSSDNQRLLVLMYAVTGQSEEAQKQFTSYAFARSNDPKSVENLRQQINYIQTQQTTAQQIQKNSSIEKQINLNDNFSSASSQNVAMMKVVNNVSVAPNSSSANGFGGRANNPTPGGDNKTGTNSNRSNNSGRTGSAAAAAYNIQQENSDDSSTSGSSSSAPAVQPQASAGAPATTSGGGGGTFTAVSMSKQQTRWFDCDTRPGLGKAPGGSYGVPVGGTSGDQTLYLEPLPSPCDNMTPKMASFDAVLIRTTDTQGTSHGINLLTGLQIFAGSQRSSTTTTVGSASPITETVNASVIGLGNATTATLNGVSGILNYSLNIANSVATNTQVVARPTLTALDRIPSTFYSGGIQTVGLNGGGVSGAQVTNIPTGISLSVTPTFIDDETMMLAVKVSRSFINGIAPIGNFNAGISVAQHAVTSNVRIKYGETLILDGLTLRSFTGEQDGVPVLQDIPIIQYLFSQKQKQQYAENVLVMITPRKLVSNASDLQKMEADLAKKGDQLTQQEKNVYNAIRSYQDLIKNLYPSIDGTLAAMDRDSSYFRQFKRAIISDDNDAWVSQSSLSRFLNDVAEMAYFTR